MSLDQLRDALCSMLIPRIYPSGELERRRSVLFIIITTANTVKVHEGTESARS